MLDEVLILNNLFQFLKIGDLSLMVLFFLLSYLEVIIGLGQLILRLLLVVLQLPDDLLMLTELFGHIGQIGALGLQLLMLVLQIGEFILEFFEVIELSLQNHVRVAQNLVLLLLDFY